MASKVKDAGPKAAVGYVRVSTRAQEREGLSLQAQKQRLEAWAVVNERRMIEILVEAESAKTADRAEFQRALTIACTHRAALVVVKLDRFSRDTIDAITIAKRLEAAGADLVSLNEHVDTTSAIGRFAFRLFASLGELERDRISERTKEVLDYKRSRNEALGNTPFGMRRGLGGLLEIHPEEMEARRFILTAWAECRSLAGVVRKLEAAGIRPRRMPWTATSVLRASRGLERVAPEVLVIIKGLLETMTDCGAAKVLNERCIEAPDTAWSRGQVRRIVRAADADNAAHVAEASEAVGPTVD